MKRGTQAILIVVILMVVVQPLLGCCESCSCESCGCEGCSCCESCGCSEDTEDDGADDAEDDEQVFVAPETEEIIPTCDPTTERLDLRDNDCDGEIDEEDCGDNIDNDGDGLTDESPPC